MKKYDHCPCVLCIIENPDTHQFLMVKNLRGMNEGFYNFPGGKMEYGENIIEALRREVREETGLHIQKAKFVGRIDIDLSDKDCQVYVFYSNKYKGTPQQAEGEVKLRWVDEIPLNMMRENDKLWLSRVMRGEEVYMRFKRGADGKLVGVENYGSERGRRDARQRHEEYKIMSQQCGRE